MKTPYPHLKPYRKPDHYFGETFYETYPLYSVTRDSDLLEQSNFGVMHGKLEQLAQEMNAPEDTVQIARAAHWAVDWVDTLYLSQSAPEEMLDAAENMLTALEQYPVLDEMDYSDRTYTAIVDYWSNASAWERRDLCQEAKVDKRRIARGNMPDPVYDYLSEHCFA